MPLNFELSYASVPLLGTRAQAIRMPQEIEEPQDDDAKPNKKYQPFCDLLEELDRLLPFRYLQDFGMSNYLGRNLAAVANNGKSTSQPNPNLHINDWYYPYGAARFSVFRGLATSTMVAAILQVIGQSSSWNPQPFIMQANPLVPGHLDNDFVPYTVTSSMYMLPPRPLAQHGTQFDGLYLITLVDERYYFQGSPVVLHPSSTSTWADMILGLADALGIIITVPTAIQDAYTKPEQDSQLWGNFENAAVLLDAVAYNLGRQVVRSLDGTYQLLTPEESGITWATNRNNVGGLVARTAGGDMFSVGSQGTDIDLSLAQNAVIPTGIYVTFPKYIAGDDPIPHFMNSRYGGPRPSSWYEQSYGDVTTIPVPISSGGILVSGMVGISTSFFHSTAKAMFAKEDDLVPMNSSGLTALAMQIAQDYYTAQVEGSLDESYPGTFVWVPEGLHDIIWSYSEHRLGATTRVMRTEWNTSIQEMQQTTPALSGLSNTLAGAGGLSVAQTIRDGMGLGTSLPEDFTDPKLATDLSPGTIGVIDFATIDNISLLPTQNRWKGIIDDEIILFEGTSGGAIVGVGGSVVQIVLRGQDGSLPVSHISGSNILLSTPDTTYGANLIEYEKGQFVYPGAFTSGGIQGVKVIPQTQSVQVLSASGKLVGSTYHYSGAVTVYTDGHISGFQFQKQEPVWVIERNQESVTSGRLYDEQLLGPSVESSGITAPVYGVNDDGAGGKGKDTDYYQFVRNDTFTFPQEQDLWFLSTVAGPFVTGPFIITDAPGQNSTKIDINDCSRSARGLVSVTNKQTLGAGIKTIDGTNVFAGGLRLFACSYSDGAFSDYGLELTSSNIVFDTGSAGGGGDPLPGAPYPRVKAGWGAFVAGNPNSTFNISASWAPIIGPPTTTPQGLGISFVAGVVGIGSMGILTNNGAVVLTANPVYSNTSPLPITGLGNPAYAVTQYTIGGGGVVTSSVIKMGLTTAPFNALGGAIVPTLVVGGIVIEALVVTPAPLSTVITYTKFGGAKGTMTFTNGLLTAIT